MVARNISRAGKFSWCTYCSDLLPNDDTLAGTQWNRQRTGSPLTRVQIYLQRNFTPRDSDVTFDL